MLSASLEAPVVRVLPHLPWIAPAPRDTDGGRAPYFVTEDGAPWTPIGQNDAITWPELNGLFRRKDVATAERYLDTLVDHGITVLRLMLEYAQFDSRFFERPAGRFRPEMIRLWDDLFTMCVDRGLRILLTPYDTFWMWRRWGRHPYNRRNGGPCRNRAGLLLCPESRKLIKGRLEFAVERWGASGALFAWDLWNEIHPIYAENSAGCFSEFISDLSEHVRRIELQRYGRTHPQTVSMFGPHVSMEACIPDSIFRHPLLDFASTHFYAEGTIDSPENTVDAAMAVARLMRQALSETPADRPFFDSETGPIHAFKDHHRTLPEPFDDEYFRHMQWAHFAGGGAGGGMRWPNRNPHSLTPGMRMAQRALARFLPLIDWRRFRRRNLNAEIELAGGDRNGSVRFAACGDPSQAVVWMIRTDTVGPDGMLRRDVTPLQPRIEVPGLDRGRYRIIAWNTSEGVAIGECTCAHRGGALQVDVPPLVADLALAITSELPSEPGRDSSPFLATSAFPDQRGK